MYRFNVQAARSCAASAGAKTLFVWQPTPFDYLDSSSSDPETLRVRAAWPRHPVMKPLNALIRRTVTDPDFVFIADLFAGESFLDHYVDASHYGDESNRRIAARIASEIVARNALGTGIHR
jgi:hypothetical protein